MYICLLKNKQNFVHNPKVIMEAGAEKFLAQFTSQK